MSDLAVKAEGLGKRYRLGQLEPYRTLRDSIMNAGRRMLHRARSTSTTTQTDLWALRDVSFEVEQGDVVGIIGRNGAGKSTLLKILSRVTEPTRGRAELTGRVGSLLEVGTGFHPELTGRENIYLNGAILGMTRAEIKAKFDEIVAFSEVEKFLDTPVKRYSSGMYVRLAFAVAAHLEPEILVVDEVLAVGDAAFQSKCLGKMSNVAREGRTVLFVSHNMAAVQSLCRRCIVLCDGVMLHDSSPAEAIEKYLGVSGSNAGGQPGQFLLADRVNPLPPGKIYIRSLALRDGDGRLTDVVGMGRPLTIEIELHGLGAVRNAQVAVMIRNNSGHRLVNFNTGMKPPRNASHGHAPAEIVTLRIPAVPFVPGRYLIDVSVAQRGIARLDFVESAGTFHVEQCDVYGSGYTPGVGDGEIFLDGDWEISPLQCGAQTELAAS